MKLWTSCRLIAVVFVLVPIFLVAKTAAKGEAADRQQILQLERDWIQSFVTMDVAANERIVAEDYLGTESDGKRSTKADILKEVKTGEALASNHLNENDVTIRFYGQTAVVNGSESWTTKNGKSGRYIWTDVFVKRNRKWQVVASQDFEAPAQ